MKVNLTLMMSEKFNLNWNNLEADVSKSFGQLRNGEYLHVPGTTKTLNFKKREFE